MSRTFEVTLEYQGKKYQIQEVWEEKFGWNDELEGVTWMYEEGNYSCDCNRSLFIWRKYPGFESMDCGDKIKLVSIKEIK